MPLPSLLLPRPRRTVSDGAAEAASHVDQDHPLEGIRDHHPHHHPEGNAIPRLPTPEGKKGQWQGLTLPRGPKGPHISRSSGSNGSSSSKATKPAWHLWGIDSQARSLSREVKDHQGGDGGGGGDGDGDGFGRGDGGDPLARVQWRDDSALSKSLGPAPFPTMKSVDEEVEEGEGVGEGEMKFSHCHEPEGSNGAEQSASLDHKYNDGNRRHGAAQSSPAGGTSHGVSDTPGIVNGGDHCNDASRESPDDVSMKDSGASGVPSSKSHDMSAQARRQRNLLLSRRKKRAMADSLAGRQNSHARTGSDCAGPGDWRVASNRSTASITRTVSGDCATGDTSAAPLALHARSLTDDEQTIRGSISRRLASLLPGMFSRSSSRHSTASPPSPFSSSHVEHRPSSWVNLSWRTTGTGVGSSGRSMVSVVSDQSWEGSGVGQLSSYLRSSKAGISAGRINRKYLLEGMIGQGQSGMVSRCRHRETGARFACKTIMKKALMAEGRLGEVYHEIEIMKLLKGHPHVVELEEVFEDATAVHIVMELCTGGDLTDHISRCGEYSERAAARTIRAVLRVVAHCHSLGVCHRDLKLSNFLLADPLDAASIKAVDFGTATFCKDGNLLTEMAGSPMYMAPEVLDESYGLPCDIWSVGVMLYTLLAGHTPFEDHSVLQIFNKIKSAPIDFESSPWPLVCSEVKDLIQRMLNRDPGQRPTAQDLLATPWVGGESARHDSLAGVMLPRMRRRSAISRLRHLALLVTSRHMSEEHMRELKEVFESMDEDGSGALSLDELREGLMKIGAHMSEEEVQRTFEFADVDGSDSIDYIEFVAAAGMMHREEHAVTIKRAFEQIDTDSSGAISVEEFAQVCVDLGMGDYDDLLQTISIASEEELGTTASGRMRQIDYNSFLSLVAGDSQSQQASGWITCLL